MNFQSNPIEKYKETDRKISRFLGNSYNFLGYLAYIIYGALLGATAAFLGLCSVITGIAGGIIFGAALGKLDVYTRKNFNEELQFLIIPVLLFASLIFAGVLWLVL
jgi:hypothetical protein